MEGYPAFGFQEAVCEMRTAGVIRSDLLTSVLSSSHFEQVEMRVQPCDNALYSITTIYIPH